MRLLKAAILGMLALVSVTVFIIPEVSADFEGGTVDTTSSVFMFLCTMQVFMMAPGIALFYGGMLRKQSMTSMMAQCIGVMAVVGVIWWAIGYSLAFGDSGNGFIGSLDYLFGADTPYDSGNGTMPWVQFMLFQGTFAIVTSCIVFGATAERVRYPAILVFLALWSILVYAPMAHMVWGGGFLSAGLTSLGIPVQDFAGGTVVHICSGISGVAAALAIGRRSSRTDKGRSHNVPIMFIGCALLWVGWFGFNCGSEGGFDEITILAMENTFVASCVSTVVWIIVQYIHVGRVSVTGLCAGVLAGLVGITPGCGFVEPWAAAVIGAVAAVVCYFGIIFMRKRKDIDDALDVMGVHGIGGIWGAISVGVFSVASLSWEGNGGLIAGQVDLLAGQVVSVLVTLVYCFVVSFVLMKVIDYVMKSVGEKKGASLSESEQMVGSDIVEHGESSYLM